MSTSDPEIHHQYLAELVTYLRHQNSDTALREALLALLTPVELSEVSKRLQIFKMLDAGLPQRQIAESLGVGIATVTRGSRAMKAQREALARVNQGN